MQEIAANQSGSVRVLFSESTQERVEGNDLPLCRVGFWLETPHRFRFLGKHRSSAQSWIKSLHNDQADR